MKRRKENPNDLVYLIKFWLEKIAPRVSINSSCICSLYVMASIFLINCKFTTLILLQFSGYLFLFIGAYHIHVDALEDVLVGKGDCFIKLFYLNFVKLKLTNNYILYFTSIWFFPDMKQFLPIVFAELVLQIDQKINELVAEQQKIDAKRAHDKSEIEQHKQDIANANKQKQLISKALTKKV